MQQGGGNVTTNSYYGGEHPVVRLPRLEWHRRDAMLSQRELAEKAGVSPATIVRIEAGKDVHPKTVRKLAEALGVRPRELLEPD